MKSTFSSVEFGFQNTENTAAVKHDAPVLFDKSLSIASLISLMQKIVANNSSLYVESNEFILDSVILILSCGLLWKNLDFASALLSTSNPTFSPPSSIYGSIQKTLIDGILTDLVLENRFMPNMELYLNSQLNSSQTHSFGNATHPGLYPLITSLNFSVFREIWSEAEYFPFLKLTFTFINLHHGYILSRQMDSYPEFWISLDEALVLEGLEKARIIEEAYPIKITNCLVVDDLEFMIRSSIDLSSLKKVIFKVNENFKAKSMDALINIEKRISNEAILIVEYYGNGRGLNEALNYFSEFQLAHHSRKIKLKVKIISQEEVFVNVPSNLQFESISTNSATFARLWKYHSISAMSLSYPVQLSDLDNFPLSLKKLSIVIPKSASYTLTALLESLFSFQNLYLLSISIEKDAEFEVGNMQAVPDVILQSPDDNSQVRSLLGDLNEMACRLPICTTSHLIYPQLNLYKIPFDSRFARVKRAE